MTRHDLQITHAECMRRLDEFALLECQHLAAHDARHVQPLHRTDGGVDQEDVATEHHHQQDHQEHERQRIHDVDEAHHQVVGASAEVAGDGAVEHADHQTDEGGDQRHRQRDLAAMQGAGQQVAAVDVGAEDVAGGQVRAGADGVPVDLVEFEGRQPWADQAGQHDEGHHHQAAHGGAVLLETTPGIAGQAVACRCCRGLAVEGTGSAGAVGGGSCL